jgi:hypothetical protein
VVVFTRAGLTPAQRAAPVARCRGPVFAEGPYGAFTTLHRSKDATLLIAGGVGITPVRALLEELTGSVIVLYRVHTMADAVLLEELQELAGARGAQVHVLTGRTGAGSPPNTPFQPRNLITLVPDLKGPPPRPLAPRYSRACGEHTAGLVRILFGSRASPWPRHEMRGAAAHDRGDLDA